MRLNLIRIMYSGDVLMKSFLGALTLSLIPLLAQAQTQPDSAEATRVENPLSEPQKKREAVELEAVTVKGFQRRYYDPVVNTGLGFDADALSTPLSVISIPTDLLEDQQVNNVEDALRNVAGLTKFKQGNGGEEKFSIRGFDASQNLLIDGARINNQFNATNIATTETANIERFEVLKGPAAILYGQGLPGGIINYVTKRPRFAREAAVEYIQGSDSYHRLELDGVTPLSSALAARGVLAYQDSEGFRDFDARERVLLNPTLLARLGERTELLLGVSFIDDQYTQDRGQALIATGDDRFVYPNFIDSSTFLGIPGWNERTESTYLRPSFELSHQVTDRWQIKLAGAVTKVEKELFDSSVRRVNADGTVVIRPSFQTGDGETRYLRLDNLWRFDGPLNTSHQVLLSASYDTIQNDGFSQSGTNDVTYDANTGGYTGQGFGLNPNRFALITDVVNRTVSLQDLVKFGDRWTLLLGLGYGDFEDQESDQQADNLSPRLGLVYQPTAETSLYGSYARGFFPSALQDINGRLLDPEKLTQSEVGAKAALFQQRLSLTAAVFDLKQNGQAVLDPASDAELDPRYQALGETRTRGFDLQAVGELGSALRLIAGYAYLDNSSDNDAFGSAIDGRKRLPGIPEHSGSLWGVYEVKSGALDGLGFGAGVFAQSGVFIGLENQSTYGGWAQVDAVAFYKLGALKMQLNIRNALDKEYLLTQALASESLAAVRVGTATPRQVFLSVAREF